MFIVFVAFGMNVPRCDTLVMSSLGVISSLTVISSLRGLEGHESPVLRCTGGSMDGHRPRQQGLLGCPGKWHIPPAAPALPAHLPGSEVLPSPVPANPTVIRPICPSRDDQNALQARPMKLLCALRYRPDLPRLARIMTFTVTFSQLHLWLRSPRLAFCCVGSNPQAEKVPSAGPLNSHEGGSRYSGPQTIIHLVNVIATKVQPARYIVHDRAQAADLYAPIQFMLAGLSSGSRVAGRDPE